MTATVTPINQLRPASATEIVELPGWDENDTIYMELRRCQLRSMVLQGGVIPNALLGAAQRLYEGTASSAKSNFVQNLQVMTTIVKQAMVNPTWQELEANQIELTEDQFSLIFAYSQKGAAALKAFRSLTGSVDTNADGTGVESASK